MKAVIAKVTAGVVEVPAEISEGTSVTILAPDEAEPITLSRAEEQELARAHAEIHRGEYIDGWNLLADLKLQGQ